MFALLLYITAILFVLCIQARDIKTEAEQLESDLLMVDAYIARAKAEYLGFDTELLGVDTALEIAEILLELGW